MQTRNVALALLVLAACGNNSGNGNGDGGNGDGGSGSIDAPSPACDYTESMDGTNATTPEATGVTIGAQNKTLCGQVDMGHFGSAASTVDVDEYSVTVAGTAELILEFEDSTPANLTDFNVTITDGSADPTILNSGDFTGALSDHGAYLAELPAGTVNLVVTATGSAAISAAIPYKIRNVADQPTTRCPDMTTATADYTEASDGATNKGNDVITVDCTKPTSVALTTAPTDNPEATAHHARCDDEQAHRGLERHRRRLHTRTSTSTVTPTRSRRARRRTSSRSGSTGPAARPTSTTSSFRRTTW